ncbi:hypothetical protein A9K55_006347 [Cordyceps militaris]|uniref:Uncharacterized protein n=1 Tax=Cordyceps militaris TaxID=73501 RepID=A0A2H4SAI1_CORMI|nr:hypothetical protein A9K55_006347 [Cordyceps militaris]
MDPSEKDARALPDTPGKWIDYIQGGGHESSSLIGVQPKSSSEATIDQFYMLKTIYQAPEHILFLENDLSLEPGSLSLANALLRDSTLWQDYLASFANTHSTSEYVFGLVQLYQRRSAKGLTGDGAIRQFKISPPEPTACLDTDQDGAPAETPDTASRVLSSVSEMSLDAIAQRLCVEDEEIVNFALVLFLDALVSITPAADINGGWWPCRSTFCVPNRAHKAYLAAVDGMFRVREVSEEQLTSQALFRSEYQGLRARAGKPATSSGNSTADGSEEGSDAADGSGEGGDAAKNSVPRGKKNKPSGTPSRVSERIANQVKNSKNNKDDNNGASSGKPVRLNLAIKNPKMPKRATSKGKGKGKGKASAEAEGEAEKHYKPYKHSPELPATHAITAIVEVKRASRVNAKRGWRRETLIQESAQMAAWISEVPMLVGQQEKDGKYRRLLLSQDQREIFVTIATYTQEYIHYIMNSIDQPAYQEALLGPECFLSMQPYGPFRVDKLSDMQKLAPLLVALSYQNYVI